jgi:hypothetical protein
MVFLIYLKRNNMEIPKYIKPIIIDAPPQEDLDAVENNVIQEELENLDAWRAFQEDDNQQSLTYGDY